MQIPDHKHFRVITGGASALRATAFVVKAVEKAKRLIKSSCEFVAGFVPPDYLVDGLLQRRYVYSLTGPTGSGKTCIVLRIAAQIATGLTLGNMEVERGRVLFFAGENPDDVRARWIKLCEEMKLDHNTIDVFFLPGTPPLSNKEISKRIYNEVEAIGPISLLIVDTSAAYFQGDDENNNKQLGDHARLMRRFTKLPGGPTVLVTCHPLKNPDQSNLVPRGGGAFLAEVDGNLVCIHESGNPVTEIDTHGKFRGPEFLPFSFKIVSGTSDKLKDSKGRLIKTVWVEPITAAQQLEIEEQGRKREDELLLVMADKPRLSMAELAVELKWSKLHVQRSMAKLKDDKLVVKQRGNHYGLTPKGTDTAKALRLL